MKSSVISLSAALLGLTACAQTAPDGAELQPDLAWVEEVFGWVAVTDADAPPKRLAFGMENTDWIIILLTCAEQPGEYDFTYFNAENETDGAKSPIRLSGEAGRADIGGRIQCEDAQIGPDCVTEATAKGETFKALMTSADPVRVNAAGELKWYPAPGQHGEAFIEACRAEMPVA